MPVAFRPMREENDKLRFVSVSTTGLGIRNRDLSADETGRVKPGHGGMPSSPVLTDGAIVSPEDDSHQQWSLSDSTGRSQVQLDRTSCVCFELERDCLNWDRSLSICLSNRM